MPKCELKPWKLEEWQEAIFDLLGIPETIEEAKNENV
jgi:hypothetical protein